MRSIPGSPTAMSRRSNSLIQAAKAKARGYGTTRHLITIVYLVAGKLTQLPTSPFVVKSGLPITT